MRSGDMPDWLIILLIFLAMPLIFAILLAIICFIDYVQWKLKEKKNEDNELQASSKDDIPWYTKISNNNEFDLTKYERGEGAYKENCYPLFIKGIKDPELEATLDDIALEATLDDIAKANNITRDELDKIMKGTIKGQFEDWHIPGQQKNE